MAAEPVQKLRQPDIMRQRPPTAPAVQKYSALNPATFVIAGPTHVCDGTCNHNGQNKKDAPSSYSSVNVANINIGPIQDHVHGPGCGCSDQPTTKQEAAQAQNFSRSVNPTAIMLPPGHVCDGSCDHSGEGKKDATPVSSFTASINPGLITLPPTHVCDGTCDHSGQNKKENQPYSTINPAEIVLGPIPVHTHGPGCGCSDQPANKLTTPSLYSSVNTASLVLTQNSLASTRNLDAPVVDVRSRDIASQGLIFLQQMNRLSNLQELEGRVSQNNGFPVNSDVFVLPSSWTENKVDVREPEIRVVQSEQLAEVAKNMAFYLPQAALGLAKVSTPSVTTSKISSEEVNQTKTYVIGKYTYQDIANNAWLRKQYGYLIGLSAEVEIVETQTREPRRVNAIIVEDKKTKKDQDEFKGEPPDKSSQIIPIKQSKQETTKNPKTNTITPVESKGLNPSKFTSLDKIGNLHIQTQAIKKVQIKILKLQSSLKTEVKSVTNTKAKIVSIELEIRRAESELRKATKLKKISLAQIKIAKIEIKKLKREINLLKKATKAAQIKLTQVSKTDIQMKNFIKSVLVGKPKLSILSKLNEKQIKRILELLKNKKIVFQLLNSKKKSKRKSYLRSLIDKIKAKFGL
ncbi:MAG: hypothetical protein ACP5N9_04425 [Candidatus Bilamarchaeum sp.]